MRILLTGGGTAGHINPALAVAKYIQQKHPETQFLYVGNQDKMEARLVPESGFDFAGLDTSGFYRKLTPKGIAHNINAVRQQMTSGKKVKAILGEFKPDVVLGTGGYVCAPVLSQAVKKRIPTLLHESNAYPGITTKLLAKRVNTVLLTSEDAKQHLHPSANCVITGNPIREDILFYSRERARTELNIKNGQICILSFGGSLGADAINKAMAAVMGFTADQPHICHIHATGAYYKEIFPKLLADQGINLESHPRLYIREYIDDMARCMNAADIIISRSGSTTVNEIAGAAKASILIPSPNVTENHQYHNAMSLGARGGAIVIEEKTLSNEKLILYVKDLTTNPEKIKKIAKKAGEMAIVDANDRIYQEIRKVLPKR